MQGHYVQTWRHEYWTHPLWPSRPRLWCPKTRPVSVNPFSCNGHSYAPFTAKPSPRLHTCAALQSAGQPRSSVLAYVHIITPPAEDRATAKGNMHKKFGKDQMCISGDMLTDRQTNAQTDTVITIHRSPMGGAVKIHFTDWLGSNCSKLLLPAVITS